MKLTAAQLEQYERDGYLVMPNLLSADELAQVTTAIAHAGSVEDERVIREKGSDDVRIIYDLHAAESPTGSRDVAALVRSPKLLEPATGLLQDDVYIFHSKCNLKPAITGQIWQWHQDFGIWQTDGLPRPRITTALLMLNDATEIGGCLYFVPGSHKAGLLDAPYDDETTSIVLKSITLEQMTELVGRYGEPVPVIGGAGTVVFFHPYLAHGSGHNMSIHSRRQLYFVYNAVSNRMAPVPRPRPGYKACREAVALRPEEAATPGR